jgi:serine/threonine protein kinase
MDRKSPKFEYDTLCREIKVPEPTRPSPCKTSDTIIASGFNLAVPAGQVMKAVDHPGCIKLYDVFEDRDKCYLVQELASGGELFDRVIANGAFSEKDAASLVKQLFEAVGYLHSCGICHRDLKPENLLMKSADQTSHYYNVLKLADFGLSTFQAGMSQNVVRSVHDTADPSHCPVCLGTVVRGTGPRKL